MPGSSNHIATDQLVALLGPGIAAAGKHPSSPPFGVVGVRAYEGDIAVGGQRDGRTLFRVADGAGPDQFIADLAPYHPVATVDPRPPGLGVIVGAAHDGNIAVSGECNGVTLPRASHRVAADQLAALLAPDIAVAGEDPCGPGDPVVRQPTYDGGIAVGGQRDGPALLGVSDRAGADQLIPLLGPGSAVAGEDPCRPGVRVVIGTAHDGGVAIGGQRDRKAFAGSHNSNHAGPDQFTALLG